MLHARALEFRWQDRGLALLSRRGRQEPLQVATLSRVPEDF